MNIRHLIILMLTTPIILTGVSCSPTVPDPGAFVDIDPAGWAYGERLTFALGADTLYDRAATDTMTMTLRGDTTITDDGDTISIPDHIVNAGQSRLALTVRHSDAYEFANLWLELSYPSGDTTLCDTLNITLADKYGKWLGQGMGPAYQFTDTIASRHGINDNATVTLRHIMRVDTLHNIEQLGIKLIKR